MKQINYAEAIELMAFAGRTDVVIMVREVEPVDYNTLYLLEKNGQVMFFLPEENAPMNSPAEEIPSPPSNPLAAKRLRVDSGK